MVSAREIIDGRPTRKISAQPGPWTISPKGGAIIASAPTGHDSEDNTKYYGGSLICESVRWEANARLIVAAPEMLEMLKEVQLYFNGLIHQKIGDVIFKAAGISTPRLIRATDSEIKEELRNEIQASGDC